MKENFESRASFTDLVPEGEVKFKEPHWRDLPCVLVLAFFLIGLIVIASIDLGDYSKTRCFNTLYGDMRVIFFEPKILAILAVAVLAALVLASAYLYSAFAHTSRIIHLSMLIEISVCVGLSVFHLANKSWLAGSFSVLWFILSTLVYWLIRPIVPAAQTQLKIALDIARPNSSMIFISALGCLFYAAWSVLVGAVIMACLGKAIAEECSSRHTIRTEKQFFVVIIYLAITNYLVLEVIKALVRVSVCYTYGWICLVSNEEIASNPLIGGGAAQNNNFPSSPAASWLGLLAGSTYSLGSICFSAIWLSVLKLLSQLLSAWSQTLMVNSINIKASEDVSSMILVWILSVFVGQIDVILSHFTSYVMVFIAVDNGAYLEGLQQTWDLLTSQKASAIICDFLATGTLTFIPWCIGMTVALFAYVYMIYICSYPYEGVFFVCCYIMMVSSQITMILHTVISSGAQTLLVASRSEPSKMKEARPEIYKLLTKIDQ